MELAGQYTAANLKMAGSMISGSVSCPSWACFGVASALFVLSACGSPDGAPPGEGAQLAPPGDTGLGGSAATDPGIPGGGASTGAGVNGSAGLANVAGGVSSMGGSATALPPPPPPPAAVDGVPVCAHYPVRSDGLLLDFDTYDPIDGSWGESSLGQLTGGTSAYSCADDGSCPPSAAIARVRTGEGGLRIQAAVPAQGYTGMVLWFGPCIDASPFGGIEVALSGELFGAELAFKLQTHLNYPIDLVNVKGSCADTTEETKWSECVPPQHLVSSVGSEPTLLSLRWADFAEGLPNTGVSPDGLVGVELQFECPSDVDCAMDLRIGALRAVP
jgi:hypothetical protein